MARPLIILILLVIARVLPAQSPYASSMDFAKYAMRLRENQLLNMEPQVLIPTASRPMVGGKYPWKTGIVTTTFWVGEQPTQNNPVPNNTSSWDPLWQRNFGGYDNPNPAARRDFLPVGFIPQQNPFYIALPYNDVTRGTTKPESKVVIPWFKQAFVKEGQSVCRDRWVAVRNPKNGRICYAQWADCGPFRTDHWQYVFGNERPKPNLNRGAGLDISPAVRDFLGISSTDVTDWKFVELREVPSRGPWTKYGENNHFVINARKATERVVSNKPAPAKPGNAQPAGPTVITK